MNEDTETQTDWLSEEVKNLNETSFDGEHKPALKLEENKVVKMTIDFSEPFKKWEDKENNTIKKIIPVKVGEADLVWWLNVRNPIYGEIVKLGVEGQREFKVIQTGSKKNTKYSLVQDE